MAEALLGVGGVSLCFFDCDTGVPLPVLPVLETEAHLREMDFFSAPPGELWAGAVDGPLCFPSLDLLGQMEGVRNLILYCGHRRTVAGPKGDTEVSSVSRLRLEGLSTPELLTKIQKGLDDHKPLVLEQVTGPGVPLVPSSLRGFVHNLDLDAHGAQLDSVCPDLKSATTSGMKPTALMDGTVVQPTVLREDVSPGFKVPDLEFRRFYVVGISSVIHYLRCRDGMVQQQALLSSHRSELCDLLSTVSLAETRRLDETAPGREDAQRFSDVVLKVTKAFVLSLQGQDTPHGSTVVEMNAIEALDSHTAMVEHLRRVLKGPTLPQTIVWAAVANKFFTDKDTVWSRLLQFQKGTGSGNFAEAVLASTSSHGPTRKADKPRKKGKGGTNSSKKKNSSSSTARDRSARSNPSNPARTTRNPPEGRAGGSINRA